MPDRMRLASLSFGTLAIPFVTRFRHASAERSETSSAWVTATTDGGVTGFGESCPRPYVTQETLVSAEGFFRRHEAALRREVDSLAALKRWVADHEAELDGNPAAWCAIELAILDALGQTSRQPVEALLSLPPLAGSFQYSAVLGDDDPEAFARTAKRYAELGFRDFKVKLSGRLDRDRQKLAALDEAAGGGVRLRLDANNLWPGADAAIDFLRALDRPIFAVEEPVGAGRVHDLARIATTLGIAIVLDESLLRRAQLAELPPLPDAWIVNLRVSKMGGLLRSLQLVEAARAASVRAASVRVLIGAQVGETSLLTRAGLTVAHAVGPALVAQEGAFGTLLLERDVCEPPLMFGAAGRLAVADHPRLVRPGLGVADARLPPGGLRAAPGMDGGGRST